MASHLLRQGLGASSSQQAPSSRCGLYRYKGFSGREERGPGATPKTAECLSFLSPVSKWSSPILASRNREAEPPVEAGCRRGSSWLFGSAPRLPPPQPHSPGLSFSLCFSVSLSPCICAPESEIPVRAEVDWPGPGSTTQITEHWGAGLGFKEVTPGLTKENSPGFQAGGPCVSLSTH